MTTEEIWSVLEELGVSSETLNVVTTINGYSQETLEDVLYVVTGYRSVDQLLEEEE